VSRSLYFIDLLNFKLPIIAVIIPPKNRRTQEKQNISPVILFKIPDATKEETRKEIISLLSQLF
jgi:hypothetical protein